MTGSRHRNDHYAVLGVEPTASARQITAAYRALVRLLHPDTRPAGPGSAERLAAVVAAYEILHDPHLRAAYDTARESTRPRPAAGRASAPSPATGRRVPVRVTPPPPGAAPGTEPLVRVGPVRVAPPDGAPGGPWQWTVPRPWEAEPWP
ncbi:J domain-containing protein [Kitasatospora sp. NPDC015120]|uniref:J domain-containing protein n=1 Tax=Kitasatospora sp. NPDC015120 TaxID=3364023 RepID=UPI0036F49FEE